MDLDYHMRDSRIYGRISSVQLIHGNTIIISDREILVSFLQMNGNSYEWSSASLLPNNNDHNKCRYSDTGFLSQVDANVILPSPYPEC